MIMQVFTPALSIRYPLRKRPYKKVKPAVIEYKRPHSYSSKLNSAPKNIMKTKSSEIKLKLSNSLQIKIIQSSFGDRLKVFQ